MYNTHMKRINTTITDAEWTAVQDLVTRSGIAFAEVVRRAIDAYAPAGCDAAVQRLAYGEVPAEHRDPDVGE